MNSFGGRHTQMHTDFPNKINFKKPSVKHVSGLKGDSWAIQELHIQLHMLKDGPCLIYGTAQMQLDTCMWVASWKIAGELQNT